MLIMNSFAKGQWGREEMIPLPVALLSVTVLVEGDGYHVFDDRSPSKALYVYRHRQPWKPPRLVCDPGWTLTCDGSALVVPPPPQAPLAVLAIASEPPSLILPPPKLPSPPPPPTIPPAVWLPYLFSPPPATHPPPPPTTSIAWWQKVLLTAPTLPAPTSTTLAPTIQPTLAPTVAATQQPIHAHTSAPSSAPISAPTLHPTLAPTHAQEMQQLPSQKKKPSTGATARARTSITPAPPPPPLVQAEPIHELQAQLEQLSRPAPNMVEEMVEDMAPPKAPLRMTEPMLGATAALDLDRLPAWLNFANRPDGLVLQQLLSLLGLASVTIVVLLALVAALLARLLCRNQSVSATAAVLEQQAERQGLMLDDTSYDPRLA